MPRILNLNNYVPTTDIEQATLKIVPMTLSDGSQPKEILFIGKKSKRYIVSADMLDDAVWAPTVLVSKDGTPQEYANVVDWWFSQAETNEEYRSVLESTFRNLQNLPKVIGSAHRWLTTTAAFTVNHRGKYAKRKTEIGKFLNNWLNRALEQQMR